MLDLGVWMTIQLVVEKEHFGLRRNPNELWRMRMEESWEIFLPQAKLKNIWEHWKLVLHLIIEDKGGDRLIESRWGKKSLYSNPSDKAKDFLDSDDDVERSEHEKEDAGIDNIDWVFFV